MMHIVSNRLPISVKDGMVIPSNGGLVRLWNSHHSTINSPSPGKWFGIDTCTNHFDNPNLNHQYHLEPLIISELDYHEFYNEFSNSTLWLLFHGLTSLLKIPTRKSWRAYQSVNNLMANLVDSKTLPNDYVIINDYHFLYLPKLLKQRRPDLKVIFYLHTPFPTSELFYKLPQAKILLSSMLFADVIGVQTEIVKNNIIACTNQLSTRCEMQEIDNRVKKIHSIPVSIDKRYFNEQSQLLKFKRNSEKNPNTFTFLGIDRLDPIKGLKEKIEGYRVFLESNPMVHGSVQLKQFIIPSREDCEIYKSYKSQLFNMIDSVNATFSNPYWQPIDAYYYQMDEDFIIQSYLSSHALMITSLADGMNLVAYEYLASQLEENPGVLCLSNQAGAAQYLHSALQFDPNCILEIQQCFQKAMCLSLEERQSRLQQAILYIDRYNVSHWRQSLINTCQLESLESSLI